MNLALFLCVALIGSNAFANDLSSWKAVAKKLVAAETYDPETGFHSLANVNPNDRGQNRQADYLGTDSVGVGEDGQYEATYIQADSEKWVRIVTTWDVDQWYHRVDAQGVLISAQHYHLVEDDQRGVIVYDLLPTAGLDDPAVLNAWAAAQARWIAALGN